MFLIQALCLTAWTLYAMRRSTLSRLPIGLFTVTLTLSSVVLSLMKQSYLPIVTGACSGAVIDAATWLLQPTQQRPLLIRLFSIIVAAAPVAVYLSVLSFTGGIIWTIHLTLGSIFVVGVLGFVLSYVAFPTDADQSPSAG